MLTNIQVKWEGNGKAPEIYPLLPPDLFANQPLVLFGRKQDRTNGTLRITGTAAGNNPYDTALKVNFDPSGNPAIAQLWGRARIKDLMNQMFGSETKSGVQAVTDTALAYRLLSPYTAFVAVSEEVRVDPNGKKQRVQVPVELPEGVSYEGIFGPENVTTGSGKLAPRTFNSGVASLSQTAADSTAIGSTPSMLSSPSPSTAVPNQSTSRIQVISADGLNQAVRASLTQHLESVYLPTGVSGEIVLEFPVQNSRVGRIVLDDKASTLQDLAAIDPIKLLLTTWSPPQSVSGTIRLKLRILP